MANMRYFPRRGTTREVGGMISTTSRKNTYKLVRIEMDNVTCKAEGRKPLISEWGNNPSRRRTASGNGTEAYANLGGTYSGCIPKPYDPKLGCPNIE